MPVPPASLRLLLGDLALGESPRWHDGKLWFADWIAGEVVVLDATGRHEVVLRMSSFPFSIDWLPDGRMLLTSADRRVLRLEADGSLALHADLAHISDRPWNEIVVDAVGNAYVNGIGFDLMGGEPPAGGVIALVRPDGSTRRVADELLFPNGMAITPDGRTLIVAESYGHRLTAFEIVEDGGLAGRHVWADLGEGAPDGICLDVEGAVWYADVPNQRCVRVRQGGEVLQTVDIDRGCFACMLGGADGRTLHVLAARWGGPDAIGGPVRSGQLLATTVAVPRAGRP